jgi:hypothetical protein
MKGIGHFHYNTRILDLDLPYKSDSIHFFIIYSQEGI